ncbi:hypothetical protein [Paenibacillus glycinis]|uniref:Uncharacterized protein n=1 Tax=Paenibacillus glycinis TaxID=2697035 RepID=A0ABW9XII1_9BACL|nr:hypothetical protein [Paenibacillus glycinis]NBD22338.1 hypothetical protein [Paenibacillus glycinis]
MGIAVIIWLFAAIIGGLLLHWIIQSAINGSVLGEVFDELRTASSVHRREMQEMKERIAELTAVIKAQQGVTGTTTPASGGSEGGTPSGG